MLLHFVLMRRFLGRCRFLECSERGVHDQQGSKAYVRPERQLKIHLPGILALVIQNKPLCMRVSTHANRVRADANEPSVSPFVSTSVRSTFVSPMNSGSRRYSAWHIRLIDVPPRTLGGALSSFLGGVGGTSPPVAVPAAVLGSSSYSVNRISSSHSGCCPPRLIAFVLLLTPSNSMLQYGSCFPMCRLLGRFL